MDDIESAKAFLDRFEFVLNFLQKEGFDGAEAALLSEFSAKYQTNSSGEEGESGASSQCILPAVVPEPRTGTSSADASKIKDGSTLSGKVTPKGPRAPPPPTAYPSAAQEQLPPSPALIPNPDELLAAPAPPRPDLWDIVDDEYENMEDVGYHRKEISLQQLFMDVELMKHSESGSSEKYFKHAPSSMKEVTQMQKAEGSTSGLSQGAGESSPGGDPAKDLNADYLEDSPDEDEAAGGSAGGDITNVVEEGISIAATGTATTEFSAPAVIMPDKGPRSSSTSSSVSTHSLAAGTDDVTFSSATNTVSTPKQPGMVQDQAWELGPVDIKITEPVTTPSKAEKLSDEHRPVLSRVESLTSSFMDFDTEREDGDEVGGWSARTSQLGTPDPEDDDIVFTPTSSNTLDDSFPCFNLPSSVSLVHAQEGEGIMEQVLLGTQSESGQRKSAGGSRTESNSQQQQQDAVFGSMLSKATDDEPSTKPCKPAEAVKGASEQDGPREGGGSGIGGFSFPIAVPTQPTVQPEPTLFKSWTSARSSGSDMLVTLDDDITDEAEYADDEYRSCLSSREPSQSRYTFDSADTDGSLMMQLVKSGSKSCGLKKSPKSCARSAEGGVLSSAQSMQAPHAADAEGPCSGAAAEGGGGSTPAGASLNKNDVSAQAVAVTAADISAAEGSTQIVVVTAAEDSVQSMEAPTHLISAADSAEAVIVPTAAIAVQDGAAQPIATADAAEDAAAPAEFSLHSMSRGTSSDGDGDQGQEEELLGSLGSVVVAAEEPGGMVTGAERQNAEHADPGVSAFLAASTTAVAEEGRQADGGGKEESCAAGTAHPQVVPPTVHQTHITKAASGSDSPKVKPVQDEVPSAEEGHPARPLSDPTPSSAPDSTPGAAVSAQGEGRSISSVTASKTVSAVAGAYEEDGVPTPEETPTVSRAASVVSAAIGPSYTIDENGAVIYDHDLAYIERKYEVFNLRVIHHRNRTGFEETKDFPIRLGDLIAGRYQVIDFLGSAAFSRAVQALDVKAGQLVCLKIIKNDKDYFDQSLDEIKLLKFVNAMDPTDQYGLVRLYNYFYYKEHLFLVCELLRANLYEFQKYNRESTDAPYFTNARIQRITISVLSSLAFLHSLGLIHSDLKPENILIKSYSRCEVKVIDLGSSCFITDQLSSYVQSRSYRAPEVILGLPYDQKVDVWSLGCIIAEMSSGYVLFQNDSLATLLARLEGLLGPIPKWMVQRGRYANRFYTRSGHIYERCTTTERYELLTPKQSALRHRMPGADPGMLSFVQYLLSVDPSTRPTAVEALNHPWLQQQYASLDSN